MPDWYYERLKACKKCPYNSNNINLNWKQKILYFLNSLEAFCSVCGCQLKAKCSEETEICGYEQMGEESKWKHIDTNK